MNTNSITHLDHIDDLIQRYRFFLVDQFGVLHNGSEPYPGAAEALRTVKRSGGRVIIISNSGKRASVNKRRMHSLGFGEDCFDELVSSGEVAWNLLKHKFIGSRFAAGANCYVLSNNDDRGAVEGLELTEVDTAGKAQLILLSGQLLDQQGLTSLCESLESVVEKNVPCVCTNPDKVAYGPHGKVFSSGAVAQWYEARGGEVIWLGKPHAEIYEHILATQGIHNRREVVCVGDSIEHDIKGGAGQDLATVLVRTGINDHVSEDELQQLYLQHEVMPDYVLPAFSARN